MTGRLVRLASLAIALWLPACGRPSGVSPCSGIDCAGHGRCADRSGEAVCICDQGYLAVGADCLADPCSNYQCVFGSCTSDKSGQAACICNPGYAGQDCASCAAGFHPEEMACLPDSPCDDLACVHGVCAVISSTASCVCQSGYAGELCDSCAAGYHAAGLTCVRDSACDPDPCAHGDCHEFNGEPACDCRTGYAGTWCDECAAGFEPDGLNCLPESSAACDPNPCIEIHRTACVEQGGGHECLCDSGYQDDDSDGSCQPDCTTANLSCGANAHCQIASGLAACACDAGFQDNDTDGDCLASCSTAGLQCQPGEICDDRSGEAVCVPATKPPIYISFLWHMHQPIYWPYQSIVQTETDNSMGFSLYTIHLDRSGPYTTWPRDAVSAGRSLAHMGAQVSFSGSLMENLDNMAGAGAGFSNWTAAWREAQSWLTAEGNPRLEIVEFGYHHPLMGLVDPVSIGLQIAAHRLAAFSHFGSSPSRGIFPPECAFSERMIPALTAAGIEWALVDNIHFDRAHVDYPYRPESNLPPPNHADQIDTAATSWVQLNGLWAPSQVSAPWGYQPHYVQYTDPQSGLAQKIIAVPAARYEGNEDARGGFGALQYEAVMSQYEQLNDDPLHPMLVVLHHDGDNYGGGSDSYYHGNFQAFISWVTSKPDRFVATTIQDYLDLFPPDPDDLIHVEDGSWSGADNGDPEFAKWNGDPGSNGYSPDRNSWSVIVAATNRVLTAENIQPHTDIDAIVAGNGNQTDLAWHYLLNGQTSCYWYWDGSHDGIWDGHPTRAANLAVAEADPVISSGADGVGPTIYPQQREPYNPGLDGASPDFEVWTLVYDVSGLSSVKLHYRLDADGQRDDANEIYSGGDWHEIDMTGEPIPSQADPLPVYQAEQFTAQLLGQGGKLIDYYVSATDSQGNPSRSPLSHVYVDDGGKK